MRTPAPFIQTKRGSASCDLYPQSFHSPALGMGRKEATPRSKKSPCRTFMAAPRLSAVAGCQPYPRTDAARAKMGCLLSTQGRSASADGHKRKSDHASTSFPFAVRVLGSPFGKKGNVCPSLLLPLVDGRSRFLSVVVGALKHSPSCKANSNKSHSIFLPAIRVSQAEISRKGFGDVRKVIGEIRNV